MHREKRKKKKEDGEGVVDSLPDAGQVMSRGLILQKFTRPQWKTQPRRSFLHGSGLAPPEPPQNPCLQSRANFRLPWTYPRPSCILSQVLRGKAHLKFTGRTRDEADSNGMVKVKEKDAKSKASELLSRRKAIHMANKVLLARLRFKYFLPSASNLILKNFIITRTMTMTIMMITAWRLPKRLPLCLPSLIIICCSKTLQGRLSRQNHASEKGMVVFVVLTD
ncbi:hypothetical protein D8674_027627 [Pyrus ussuriensis x Pyrus communis]|uniref:Uncharacterized protein n=1 Tax=Pyrus ussuriensis x Pyrus communis TaxID=2448454 RepID=A0A5N5ID93_9ROSA|nr:hypothetical protein D8674_027627 [Pyrus ussuriensis x Pyrus communis]